MVVVDFGYCSCARLQNVSRDYKITKLLEAMDFG
jgi:hypothetical protein